MGWPLEPTFFVPPEVPAFFQQAADKGRRAHDEWQTQRAQADSGLLTRFDAHMADEIPADVWEKLPEFEVGSSIATRKASQAVLNAICDALPQLIDGSADLAGSNGTTLKDYQHIETGQFGPNRRNIHYGVREHAMGAVMNGMVLHKGIRPYAGTFLIFSDYMRPAIRLAALMNQPVIFVFTHDSVFLGEDGPTHQPVEHAMSLRLIPNSWVIRPGDGTETAAAWRIALERKDGPSSLLLTRQGLPKLPGTNIEGALKGGYVVKRESTSTPDLILMATGSELHLATGAAELLGPGTRVVSLPCWEMFEQQSSSYRESVLPAAVIGLTLAEHFCGGALTTVMFATMMSHIDSRIGATHFTVLATVEVLGKSPGFIASGFLAAFWGYPALFGLGALLSLAFLLILLGLKAHMAPASGK